MMQSKYYSICQTQKIVMYINGQFFKIRDGNVFVKIPNSLRNQTKSQYFYLQVLRMIYFFNNFKIL